MDQEELELAAIAARHECAVELEFPPPRLPTSIAGTMKRRSKMTRRDADDVRVPGTY